MEIIQQKDPKCNLGFLLHPQILKHLVSSPGQLPRFLQQVNNLFHSFSVVCLEIKRNGFL